MITVVVMLDEKTIHCAIIDWLHVSLPKKSVVHHSPNEGRHHVSYRVQQKRMGMQAGWPDIEIFVSDEFFYTKKAVPIFLEVKTKKGYLTNSQCRIIERLGDLGAQTGIVRSIDDAKEFLSKIIELRAVNL